MKPEDVTRVTRLGPVTYDDATLIQSQPTSPYCYTLNVNFTTARHCPEEFVCDCGDLAHAWENDGGKVSLA